MTLKETKMNWRKKLKWKYNEIKNKLSETANKNLDLEFKKMWLLVNIKYIPLFNSQSLYMDFYNLVQVDKLSNVTKFPCFWEHNACMHV